MATLYVGSEQTYKTLAEAVAAASAGDTVIVKGSEYSLTDERVRVDKSLTLKAEGDVTLRGLNIGGANFDLVVDGFNFVADENDTNTGYANNASCISQVGTLRNVTVQNCSFDISNAGHTSTYGMYLSLGTWGFENLVVVNNTCDGVLTDEEWSGYGLIYAANVNNADVSGNIVNNANAHAIQLSVTGKEWLYNGEQKVVVNGNQIDNVYGSAVYIADMNNPNLEFEVSGNVLSNLSKGQCGNGGGGILIYPAGNPVGGIKVTDNLIDGAQIGINLHNATVSDGSDGSIEVSGNVVSVKVMNPDNTGTVTGIARVNDPELATKNQIVVDGEFAVFEDTATLVVNGVWKNFADGSVVAVNGQAMVIGVNAFADINSAAAVAEANLDPAAKIVIAEGSYVKYDTISGYWLNTKTEEFESGKWTYDYVIDAAKTYDVDVNGEFYAYQHIINNGTVTVSETGLLRNGEATRVMGGTLILNGKRGTDGEGVLALDDLLTNPDGTSLNNHFGNKIAATANTQLQTAQLQVKDGGVLDFNNTSVVTCCSGNWFANIGGSTIENAQGTLDLDNSIIYVCNTGGYGSVASMVIKEDGVVNFKNSSVINLQASPATPFALAVEINNAGTITMTGNVTIDGNLINNGTVNVTGESTLNIAKLTGNAISLNGAALSDSVVKGTVYAYGENSISGATAIDSLRMGYKAGKADGATITITGAFNGSFIVGWEDGYTDSTYVLNIGDAEGARTTVGKESAGGSILNVHGANGSANIVNTDYYLHQLRAKGDVNFTNSNIFLKNVDQAIFATVTLDSTTWDAENNFNSSVAIGSDSYAGNAKANAALILKNGSKVYAYNLGANNAGDYTVAISVEASTIEVVNNLFIGTGAYMTVDALSSVKAGTLTGAGTITIDASDYTGGIVKVVDADKSTFTGEINVENLAEGVKVIYGADGDVVLSDFVSEKFYVDAAFTGNTGAEVAEGKFINVNAFASLGDAMAAADANISEFVVSSNTSEALSGKTISGKIVAAGDAVTVTDSANSDYVYVKNAVIGENVTIDAKYFYIHGGESTIAGNVTSSSNFYCVMDKLVITGTANVYNTFSRYYSAADEGIYIVGNAEAGKAVEAAVQYHGTGYLGHYSGTFSVQNSAAEFGYLNLVNTHDNPNGTAAFGAKVVLDNAYLKTVGGPNTQPGQLVMQGNVAIELTNKSVLDISGPKQFGYLGMSSGVITVDDSTFIMGMEGQGANTVGGTLNVVNGGSVISLGKVINNGSINISGDSLFSATKITGTGTITIDAAGVTEMTKVIDVNAAIEGTLTVENLEAGMGYLVAEDGDVIIAEVGAIKVDDAYGAYAAGTVVDGMVVGLNAFATVNAAVKAANAETTAIKVVGGSASLGRSVATLNPAGLVVDMGNHGVTLDANCGIVDKDGNFAEEAVYSYITDGCQNIGQGVTVKADLMFYTGQGSAVIDGTVIVNSAGGQLTDLVVGATGDLQVADYMSLSCAGSSLTVNGKFTADTVIYSDNYSDAVFTVAAGGSAVVNNIDYKQNSVVVAGNLTVKNADVANLTIAEGGVMAIDAAGVTGTKLLLDVDTIANAGTLTVENAASNMFLVTAEDGDIWLVDNTIYVNAEWAGAEFGTEVAAGKFFGLNAFATLDAISTEASQGIRKVVYTAAEDATVTIVGEAYTAYRYNSKNSYVLAGREVEVEVSAGDVVFEFTNAKGDFKLTSSLEQDSSVISTDAIYVNFAWREDASSLGNGMALGENAFVDFEAIDPSLSQGVRSVNYIADANGTLTLIIDADAYTAYSFNGKNSYVLADRTVTLELEVVAGETYEIKFTNAKGDYDLAATFEPAAVLPDGMADDADDVVTGANVVDMSADSSFTNWVGSEDKVDWFAITNFDPKRTTFTLDVAEGGSRVSVAIYSQTGDGALRQVRSWSTATSGSATLNLSASTKYFVKVTGSENSTYTMQLA